MIELIALITNDFTIMLIKVHNIVSLNRLMKKRKYFIQKSILKIHPDI